MIALFLLVRRGISSSKEAASFLEPKEKLSSKGHKEGDA